MREIGDQIKRMSLLLWVFFVAVNFYGQSIKVSEKLSLIQLSERTYIHTCQNNNGLVFINEGEALLVSTPDSDTEAQNLINWVKKEKKAEIVGYVIDRWHPDAMEGLDVVHDNEIESYSYTLTRQIATDKGLPVPKNTFDPKTEIQVGGEAVVCHYLGEAHTKDGIVVWIPAEQILFGGNAIRNVNGWLGNIADASLDKWSETVTKIREEYGSAKIVVPGHGKHGGTELVDYTIGLYSDLQPDDWSDPSLNEFPESNEDFYIKAESDSIADGKRILKNAVVVARDPSKYVRIESPLIIYQPGKGLLDSEKGELWILINLQEVIS